MRALTYDERKNIFYRKIFFLPLERVYTTAPPYNFLVREPSFITILFIPCLDCLIPMLLNSEFVMLYTQYSYINIQPQLSKFTHPQNSPDEFFFLLFFYAALNADAA